MSLLSSASLNHIDDAAITVAQRVAAEVGVDVGDRVGYAIRFDDKTSHKTEIKFMTDGERARERVCHVSVGLRALTTEPDLRRQ